MLALVSTAFVLWVPDEVGRIRGDVAAAATYTSNWYLVGTDHSYFSTFARPSPFAHLWSLAIEEQFYLLWPPVLFLMWKLAGGRAKRVSGAILAGAAGSVAALFLLYEGGDPSRVYYGTDTRAAGLLIGAALAVVWRPFAKPERDRPRIPKWALDGATVASLGFLVFAFMRFEDLSSFTYRPGLLLVSLATATLIGAAVHPDARIAKILGTAPLRWLGKRSYGVYIWYFPVFVLTRPGVDYDITIGTAFAMRIAATLTLAELSYRFIEEPVRNGALGRLVGRIRQRLRTPGGVGRRTALRLVGAFGIASLLFASLTTTILEAPAPVAEAADPSSLVGVLDQDDGVDPMVFVLPTPHAPVDVRPPVAIGDSVMTSATVGAARPLQTHPAGRCGGEAGEGRDRGTRAAEERRPDRARGDHPSRKQWTVAGRPSGPHHADPLRRGAGRVRQRPRASTMGGLQQRSPCGRRPAARRTCRAVELEEALEDMSAARPSARTGRT